MYPTIQTIHSYWAYLVLLIVVLAAFNAIFGYFSKREYAPRDFRISLFAMIVVHIQFLIGIVLYFVSPFGLQNILNLGMGAVMENPLYRLYAIEHPLVLFITVSLITVGYSKHKEKLVSAGKFKTLAIFYGIALALLLSRIPWKQWFD